MSNEKIDIASKEQWERAKAIYLSTLQSAEEKGNMNAAYEKCPLVAVIQAADNIASHILETKA